MGYTSTSLAPEMHMAGVPLSVTTSEASLVQSGRESLLSASLKSVTSFMLVQACVASLGAALCAPLCVSP